MTQQTFDRQTFEQQMQNLLSIGTKQSEEIKAVAKGVAIGFTGMDARITELEKNMTAQLAVNISKLKSQPKAAIPFNGPAPDKVIDYYDYRRHSRDLMDWHIAAFNDHRKNGYTNAYRAFGDFYNMDVDKHATACTIERNRLFKLAGLTPPSKVISKLVCLEILGLSKEYYEFAWQLSGNGTTFIEYYPFKTILKKVDLTTRGPRAGKQLFDVLYTDLYLKVNNKENDQNPTTTDEQEEIAAVAILDQLTSANITASKGNSAAWRSTAKKVQ